MRYLSDLGPEDGPVRYPNDLDCLAVVAKESGKHVFSGIGSPAGSMPDPNGGKPLALYRLLVKGSELEGLWICVGREFLLAPV